MGRDLLLLALSQFSICLPPAMPMLQCVVVGTKSASFWVDYGLTISVAQLKEEIAKR